MECVRFASRCGNKRSIRPHHCAPFKKRCAMTRTDRLPPQTLTNRTLVHSMRTLKLVFARSV
eukprot:10254318-Lingulodinium_polyedra.AAC.1